MASGKPIIATRKAVEGIEEIRYINAETEEEFVNRTIAALTGDINAKEFQINKDFVNENNSPKASIDLLLKIIEKIRDIKR